MGTSRFPVAARVIAALFVLSVVMAVVTSAGYDAKARATVHATR